MQHFTQDGRRHGRLLRWRRMSGRKNQHGFMSEKTETGDTVVGAWGNAITGTSATVYKPQYERIHGL